MAGAFDGFQLQFLRLITLTLVALAILRTCRLQRVRATMSTLECQVQTMLLGEMFPSFSEELQLLLTTQGEHDLAAQVARLQIVDRCRCGDDFCASIYTQPKPKGAYGPGHRNVALTPAKGMLILDVVDGAIAQVEILYRDEIRRRLLETLG